jgi:hypothetical protein
MSVEHVDEPGHVVLVGVAHDEDVDATGEERSIGPDAPQRQLGIRPAVDEHRCSVRRLDEDRVALPDVENGQVELTVRPLRDRDRKEERDEAAEDRQRS